MSTICKVEMQGISKSFYEQYILNEVNIDFYPGEVHALLGENGAGKTSLMNILTGVYAQDKGHIFINGKAVKYKSPGNALKAGIGMVHQRFSLVEKLSVIENIILGDPRNRFILNNKDIKKGIEYYQKLFDFHFDPDMAVENFPVGSRQKIEIIKMLIRNVSILILDEPTSVLTAQESEQLMITLKKIAKEGKTVIFISHKMNEVMQVADRISVLRKGKKVASIFRKDAQLTELSEMMVGKQVNCIPYELKEINKEQFLCLDQINAVKDKKKLLTDINLCVYQGEILGIAGVDGNGQRELADIISGHDLADSGKIMYHHQDISKKSILERIEMGFAYIPENRSEVATAGQSSIWENLIMRIFRKKEYSMFGILNLKKLKEYAKDLIIKYDIVHPGIMHPAIVLSGGNLQKLILGREIDANGEVYIFIHPTRGLDISSTNFVRKQIVDLSLKGKIVIVISGDLDELFEISDRIAVMYEGKIMEIIDRESFNIMNIGLLMSGIHPDKQEESHHV